ncbi:Ig-like domain-containing protein [uncultured Treponema sp.]|uniref:Ig-like domain-containing protein n=1 Tax=uncultured Treponema sp. TaxID=162155 RepID=UPI002589060B|nr:Ig-like domain-containing protein [uncultured Treponema sp.]
MKKMLRIAAALAALLAMTNFIGCKNDDDDGGDEPVAVEKVEITSTSTTNEVEVGKKITLTATVSPENATNKTATWTSSDTTVATVKDGVVTGVKEGKVTITAKAGEKTAAVEVTVKAAATSGGETGGETGGSGSGETGGSTGGTTGGETGGETGTTGFENTYWVLEEEVSDVSGIKITLKNIVYTYIKDSTNGTIYFADIDSAMEELIKADGGTRTVTYEGATGDEFKYIVDGKNITLTATAEGKTPLTGTIVDENTLKITDNSDGEPIEHTLKKATAAPTEATVTVEVTAAPSTGVNAAWDFNVASLTAVGLDVTNKVKPNADKEIAVTSGSGATLTLLAQTGKSLKIQSAETGGLNVGAGTTETEVLSITVEGACTLKFNGKGSSGATFATSKPNSFSVNGTKVYERASADETAYQDFTYSITEAGTYKIAASGMIFAALTCE